MYEIREYEKKDRDQLIELWVEVVVEEYGYKEWEDEIKLDELKYEKILVVENENKLIGSMAYKKVNNKTAELKRVYIYKEIRGEGITKELYNRIMKIIKEEKYEKVIIETWENFQSGINFYCKNNFKLVLKDGMRYIFELDVN